MKQSYNNMSFEQFSAKRAVAEAEAKAIMNDRNDIKRAVAEAETIINKKLVGKHRATADTPKIEETKRKAASAKHIIHDKQIKKSSKKGCWITLILIVLVFSGLYSMCSGDSDDSADQELIFENIENENVVDVELVEYEGVSVKIDPNLDIRKQLQVYYDYVYSLSDGFYIIEQNDKYGLATKEGVVVTVPKYDYIYSLDSETNLIKVELDDKLGFINKNGAEVLKPQYDYIYSIDSQSGLIKVEKEDRYGFFNPKTKKLVTPCNYTYIYGLSGGLYKVEQGDKTGYLNKDGSVLKEPE